MIGESINYEDNTENNVTTANASGNPEIAEDASEFNAYNCDNFQHNQQQQQQHEQLSSSNNDNSNKLQLSLLEEYPTPHADLQRQQCDPINDGHSAGSELPFEQTAQQQNIVASFENEASAPMEQPKVAMYNSEDYHRVPPARSERAQEEIMSIQQRLKLLNDYSTTVTPISPSNPTSSPVNPLHAKSDNTNSPSVNYELCASYSAGYNPNGQQQQQNYMQMESVNFILAHQWRERREKLPISPLNTTFYTEWQRNRPQVANIVEHQKRKLECFKRKVKAPAEEKLAPVNQPKTSSKPRKISPKPMQQPPQPCNSQEQQQQQQLQQLHQAQHHYGLNQMQQQNHLLSLAPEEGLPAWLFAQLSARLNPSNVSAHPLPQQMLPYVQWSQQSHMQQAPQPNNDNSNYNLPLAPQQQQQQLKRPIQFAPYYQSTAGSEFFDKWQKANEKNYQEALQESALRNNIANGSRSRKGRRKFVPLQIISGEYKETASANPSEAVLVINESVPAEARAEEASNVAHKSNDNPQPKPNPEGLAEGSVIVNLNDVKDSLTTDIAQSDHESILSKLSSQSLFGQGGMYQNNFAMLRDWLQTQQQQEQEQQQQQQQEQEQQQQQQQQQQDADQRESDVAQYGNAE